MEKCFIKISNYDSPWLYMETTMLTNADDIKEKKIVKTQQVNRAFNQRMIKFIQAIDKWPNFLVWKQPLQETLCTHPSDRIFFIFDTSEKTNQQPITTITKERQDSRNLNNSFLFCPIFSKIFFHRNIVYYTL